MTDIPYSNHHSQFYVAGPPAHPHPQYVPHAEGHIVGRGSDTIRKRPKYTRSKTGCLTCRIKKVKCDETKPSCLRCAHGGRDCTWPEGTPARKKSVPRANGLDRPSPVDSSDRLSDVSSPSTREPSPPGRDAELQLPPLGPSRRHSETLHYLPPLAADSSLSRRSTLPNIMSSTSHGYALPPHAHAGSSSSGLPAIPETQPHFTHVRYDTEYSNVHFGASAAAAPSPVDPRHSHTNTLPPLHHHPHSHHPHHQPQTLPPISVGQWAPPPVPLEPIEPYYPSVNERHVPHHHAPQPSAYARPRFQ